MLTKQKSKQITQTECHSNQALVSYIDQFARGNFKNVHVVETHSKRGSFFNDTLNKYDI